MYYINKEIQFVSGIEVNTYGFHFISRYQVDFINGITEIQISSSKSINEWINNNYSSPYVSLFEINEVPNFDQDPVNWILRKLVTKETTLFYGCEIINDLGITNILRNTGWYGLWCNNCR